MLENKTKIKGSHEEIAGEIYRARDERRRTGKLAVAVLVEGKRSKGKHDRDS